MMKWHISIAVTATTIIVGHAAINLYKIAPVVVFDNIKTSAAIWLYPFCSILWLQGIYVIKSLPDLDGNFISQQP